MEDGQISTMLRNLVTISPASRKRQQRCGFGPVEALEHRVLLSRVSVELGYISDVPDEEISGLVYGEDADHASVEFDFRGQGSVSDSSSTDDFGRFSVDYPATANAGDTVHFRLNIETSVGDWQPYVLSGAGSDPSGWPNVNVESGRLNIRHRSRVVDEVIAVGRDGSYVTSNSSEWGSDQASVDLSGLEGEYLVVVGSRNDYGLSDPELFNLDIEAVEGSLDTYIYQVTTSEGVSLVISVSDGGNAVSNATVEIDWNGDGLADAVCTTDESGQARLDVTGQIPQELVTIYFRSASADASANMNYSAWQSLQIDFSNLDAWFASGALS